MPMEQTPQAPAEQEGSQDATGIIETIGKNLMILRDLFEKSQAIVPEDKQRLDGVISEFQGLVSENLSMAPGEGKPKEPSQQEAMGAAPVETAGAKETVPA